MIKKISIRNQASYGAEPEELDNLKKINFLYGANATGKTTISRVIADASAYPNCEITWQNEPVETLVYNRDFIEKNFNQPDELEGIFTLGEKDKETLAQIRHAKEELDSIDSNIANLKTTLEGTEDRKGKHKELQECEDDFTERCWRLKTKFDDRFKEAFKGYRADKRKFKEQLIEQSVSNSATSTPLNDLEQRAETVFAETPLPEETLAIPECETLLAHEANPVLKKKVIGKSDIDIAKLIEKLGNSDWVKQGREFYGQVKPICPFCQQDTDASLEKSLNEYFDDTFKSDSDAIERLLQDYKRDSKRLLEDLGTSLENPTKYLNEERFQAEKNLLATKIDQNIQRIKEKKREPSKPVELGAVNENLDIIKTLLNTTNAEINTHNKRVENLQNEKSMLTRQVWRYLLDQEIKDDLAAYESKKADLRKAINNLQEKISNAKEKKQNKEKEIGELEKDTTSIQPTIDEINRFLNAFGFQGFKIAKSVCDRFYKIERPDHSNAKATLSEGERSFIAFLYFYHLLKGNNSESGTTSDRVIVFDDPVSSLDSNILFIVSSLIQKLFEDVRSNQGTTKQIFVLTHNVYFHKQVSFDSKRSAKGKQKDETFWMVRKSNNVSNVQEYKTNPIKNEYELLWSEIRNSHNDKEHNNLSIQNTLRRILEYYFKILGNVDFRSICAHFKGREALICQSLFSWVNEGSHAAHDSLYISHDDSVKNYLNVFKQIFEKTENIAHYDMMMGKEETENPRVSSP